MDNQHRPGRRPTQWCSAASEVDQERGRNPGLATPRRSHLAPMRFTSTDPTRPLRERRLPLEFIIWYAPAFQGWVSVHSFAPYGDALRVAKSIVEVGD